MPARVIIGSRSDINQVGMWVSRPGRSAYSSDPSDFLIDTGRIPQSPIIAGAIVNPVLSADTNNFRAPTVSATTTISPIRSTNISGQAISNIDPPSVNLAMYNSHTGLPNRDGIALFFKDYFFKSDQTPLLGSGKIPLMHVSIGDPNVGTGSATVGDNYPKVYVYDNKIRLAVYQNWDAVIDTTWYRSTSSVQYYPAFFSNLVWNPFVGNPAGTAGEADPVQVRSMYVGPTPPNTLPTNCVINYAVYNIEMVLP